MHKNTNPKKLVLFVDNCLESVIEHRQRVEDNLGLPTWFCRTLNAAKIFIDQRSDVIALVVTTTYMPGNLDMLLHEGENACQITNHGELLGRYIHYKYKLPCIYLTAFPNDCSDINANVVFSKHPVDTECFINKIKDILEIKDVLDMKAINTLPINYRGHVMLTRGEQYKYSNGEKEAIEKSNVLIKEAFDKLKEAKQVLTNAGSSHTIDFYYDRDSDGNYELPVNFVTPLTIHASVDSQWLSSTQDC